MSIQITSSAVLIDDQLNVFDHAAAAAAECIRNSTLNKRDIDVVVYIGVTKDNLTFEPSAAALIQKHLKINTDYNDYFSGKRTFAFDIVNTNCGFLYAVQTIGALALNNKMKHALVIASDVNPMKEHLTDYPYANISAAVIVSSDSNKKRGFQDILFNTDTHNGYGVTVSNNLLIPNSVRICFDERYVEKMKLTLVNSWSDYIASRSPAINTYRMKLISTELSEGFAREIAETIGVPENSIIRPDKKYGRLHTTSFIAAYHTGQRENVILEHDTILFAGCGAGITTGVGIYNVI